MLYFVSSRAADSPGTGRAARLPLHRRPGHRRVVGGGADVHRRDLAGRAARAAGGAQPVQHRGRHPGRLPVELRSSTAGRRARDRRPGGWMLGMPAVPAALFFLLVLRHAREPALAGQAAPARRGDAVLARGGQRRPDGGRRRDRRVAATRKRSRPTSRSSRASTGSRSCWR